MNHNKSLILNETRFINVNLTDNIILPSIKLRDSIIPPVPFIWYREEELLCPIDGLFKVNNISIKKLLNIFDNSLVNIIDKFNFNKYYVVVQKNLLDTSANLYLSYHSYIFLLDCIKKGYNKNSGFNMMEIPKDYVNEKMYKTFAIPVFGIEFLNNKNSLKNKDWNIGSVLIHNESFSPPGHFNFKVRDKFDLSIILTYGFSENLENSEIACLFILDNCLKSNKTEQIIDLIKKNL